MPPGIDGFNGWIPRRESRAIDENRMLADREARANEEALHNRIQMLENELRGRISSGNNDERMAHEGNDLLYALHNHAQSPRHRGMRDPEPQALAWLIQKIDRLDRKLIHVIDIIETFKVVENNTDDTDDVLRELKKLVDE